MRSPMVIIVTTIVAAAAASVGPVPAARARKASLVFHSDVASGDIADPVNEEPLWHPEIRKRGYAVVARPTVPITYHTYMPRPEELGKPLVLRLAPGETGSGVIFVRSLGKAMTVHATGSAVEHLGNRGYNLANIYSARFIYVRAAEDVTISKGQPRYLVKPMFLRHSDKLSLKANDGGQFWYTVEVPVGTPPGSYKSTITIIPVGAGSEKATKLPVVVAVRDMELSESDVAYGLWNHPDPGHTPKGLTFGPLNSLPGGDEIYLADQRRHGMNTLVYYCSIGEGRKDDDGNYLLSFHELDAAVQRVKQAGLCRDHPLILLFWQRAARYGRFAGGARTIMDIHRHGKEAGWPDILFTVHDEPANNEEQTQAANETLETYIEPRKKGVRTVTAYPNLERQAHLYDVWIVRRHIGFGEVGRYRWESIFDLAKQHGAEVWMYDYNMMGRNPLLDRFYAGLWTWRTGVKGNMCWGYGRYVRFNDQGMPESRLSWEARLAGVNDYRYLHTLEKAVAAAEAAWRMSDPRVAAAKSFLEDLRARVPLDAWKELNNLQGMLEKVLWNPVPGIKPGDYDRIREECASHIQAVQKLTKR